MIGPRQLAIAAGAVLLFGWNLLLMPAEAIAQNSCRSACWQAYGTCYKATNNRQRCQAHLKRCLDGCIRRRHR